MDEITLKAYAKINIGLDITGRRIDGYHLIKTVMQTIGIYDSITVSMQPFGNTDEISITSNRSSVPKDETNIAWKAADAVKKAYGIKGGLHIDIQKHIPMAAGLAGGSTDGAAVIKAMNSLFGLDMSLSEMDEIALRLGADVPFCLREGTWLSEGIGEKLTKLSDMPKADIVIVKPGFDVPTKWCYGELDKLENIPHPDMDVIIEAIEENRFGGICENIGNVLELATCPAHPEIGRIKEKLLECGADCACMSGSGGTTFGLFKGRDKAEQAFGYFKTYKDAEECFLTEFVY